MPSNESGNHRRLTQVNRAINTNWFSSDIQVSDVHHKMWMYKHTLQIHVTADTTVNLQYTIDGITQTYILNCGNTLDANTVHIFDILVPPGASYNIQHSTTQQDVSVIIAETKTAMI